jgi:hypothetical protein
MNTGHILPGSRRGRDASAAFYIKWPRMHAISPAGKCGQACLSPSTRARRCAANTSRQRMQKMAADACDISRWKMWSGMPLALDESQEVCGQHFTAADAQNGRGCMRYVPLENVVRHASRPR